MKSSTIQPQEQHVSATAPPPQLLRSTPPTVDPQGSAPENLNEEKHQIEQASTPSSVPKRWELPPARLINDPYEADQAIMYAPLTSTREAMAFLNKVTPDGVFFTGKISQRAGMDFFTISLPLGYRKTFSKTHWTGVYTNGPELAIIPSSKGLPLINSE